MLTVSSSPCLPVALPACAVGLVLADHHRVDSIVRMPLRTVSLDCIARLKSVASQEVDACRNWLQMVRVAAAANAAKVVDLQAGRYRTDKGLEDNDVRHPDGSTAGWPDLGITVAAESVRAEPTPRDRADVDLRPDPLGQTRVAPGTIEHIDSTQSVVPRGVDAPAGLLAAIVPAGGAWR
jgi:hypothetical protein